MAPQWIRSHDWDAKESVHIHLPDPDGRCNLCLKLPQPQRVTILELNIPKWLIWQPAVHIHIHCIAVPNFLRLINLPRAARKIQILIKIYWLMKKHPLVCALSAIWWYTWHLFWRPEQSIEHTCKWWPALIKTHRIFDNIILYLYYWIIAPPIGCR